MLEQGLSGNEAALLQGYRAAQKGNQVGTKHDPFAGTPTGPYSHGQFGLFNMPGSLRSIFSAVQTGETLASDLPVLQGLYNNMSGYNSAIGMSTLMTGVTAGELDEWSNQPTEKCAEPPSGGLMKLCTIVNPYGKVWGGTEKLDITEVGEVTHRDEPVGFNFMNDPLQGSPIVPTNIQSGSLEMELYRRTWLSVFTFFRLMAPLVYTSSPANTAASQNAKQFVGMDIWINENNKLDALEGSICTAANSVIRDVNFMSIDENPVGVYREIEEAYRHCKYNTRMQRLDPAVIKMVVTEDLFKKLTRSVPITEHLHALVTMVRSAEFNQGRINIDASDATRLGQQMYNERWIPIDGDMVPVVVDTYIPELNVTTNANLLPGEFASDVRFVPYTVMGGIPVTGWDFKSWNNPDVQNALQLFRNISTMSVEDGNKTLWFRYEHTSCIQLAYVIAPRLVMLTPQIAGRVRNIAYTPLLHVRSGQPDSQYYLDGGRTTGESSSFYNSWSSDPSIIGSR